MTLRRRSCTHSGHIPSPVTEQNRNAPSPLSRLRNTLAISPNKLFIDWVVIPVFCIILLIYVWGVDRLVQSKVPASVLSMLILFFALLLLSRLPNGTKRIDDILSWCEPCVEWLLKWMTILFSPALVVLPAQKVLDGPEIGRVIGVFVIGYLIFVPLAVVLSRSIQTLLHRFRKQHATRSLSQEFLHDELPMCSVSEFVSRSASILDLPAVPAPAAAPDPPSAPAISMKSLPVESPKPILPIPIHPSTLLIYTTLFIPSLIIAFATDTLQPAHLCITVFAFYAGQAVPPRIKVVLHPLLTCGFLTVMGIWAIAAIQGDTLKSALLGYSRSIKATKILTALANGVSVPTPGAGDVLYSLLDAAVAILAVRMYKERAKLKENLMTIMTAISTLSIASLFFHAGLSRGFGMELTNALGMSVRFVTTPLALQIFSSVLTEGNQSLGVIMVLVSGVLGDVVGSRFVQLLGVPKDDVLSLGIATGSTSHAVGTAGLLHRNPPAAALSSLTFVLFATASVVWVSIPPVADALRTLAGGTG